MTATRLQISLLLLRLSLGGFMLLWAVEKFFRPEVTAQIFQKYYSVEIGNQIAMLAGLPQTLLTIAFLLGVFKFWSYGITMLLHAASVIVSYQPILAPFEGINHLFLASVPVLAAFVALFLLRDQDSFLALSGGKSGAGGRRFATG